MEDLQKKLHEVNSMYEALCEADRTYNLSLIDDQNASERQEYARRYMDWYVSAYALMNEVFDYNDDMGIFKSVMKDNDGNAAVLRGNLRKIEASYKVMMKKIETKIA